MAFGQKCEFKRLLTSCGAEPVGICQYCGRAFCAAHGVLLEEHQEVCFRKTCVAKRDDVARHLVYKAHVTERNRSQLCGVTTCDSAPATQCSRCRGRYCPGHTDVREDSWVEGGARVARKVSLCHHCWQRRPLWQRR